MSSPCHHCPKCPCKEHDTCREYQEYRAAINKINKRKTSDKVAKDMTIRG
jgi:hypothetical protein